MGVMGAYIYSVGFLPAALSVLPLNVKGRNKNGTQLFDRFADFVIQRKQILLWSTLTLIMLIAVQIPRIEINEKFNQYFDTRYQFRLDNDHVVDNLTGFYSINYSLGAGESGGISNPEYLAKVEEFAEWYRKQPGVTYVSTLTDTMKRLNKNMHNDDPTYYRLPDSRELAAQYLLLYELSLPFGLDLNNQINIDKSSTKLQAVLQSISTRDALDLEDRAQQWLKENGAGAHGVERVQPAHHVLAHRQAQPREHGHRNAVCPAFDLGDPDRGAQKLQDRSAQHRAQHAAGAHDLRHLGNLL